MYEVVLFVKTHDLSAGQGSAKTYFNQHFYYPLYKNQSLFSVLKKNIFCKTINKLNSEGEGENKSQNLFKKST
jgi:hypothetical protein